VSPVVIGPFSARQCALAPRAPYSVLQRTFAIRLGTLRGFTAHVRYSVITFDCVLRTTVSGVNIVNCDRGRQDGGRGISIAVLINLPTRLLLLTLSMAPTTPKKQHLTRDQRRDICTLKSSGMTHQQIVKHFLFVFCTVITIRQVSYVCLTDYATPQKRSGKPLILSLEQIAELIAFVTSSCLA
jgi:hypothetical protein